MFNVKDTFKSFSNYLYKHNITNPTNELYILCDGLLNKSRADLVVCKVFTKREYNLLKKAVKKRAKHVPLQLILKYSIFYGVTIKESKHTLTPRPETELLIDIIASENKDVSKVLDLCCGSGCIGLGLAKLGHKVTCTDVSKHALKCAKVNAKLNNLMPKFVKSDMFNSVTEKFDVIVSNPPYIPTKDIEGLQNEVIKYDPKISLDGGATGLDFYNIIANEAKSYLNKNGKLYLEFGIGQAEQIKNMLKKNFKNIIVIKDYNNIERFIKAELK